MVGNRTEGSRISRVSAALGALWLACLGFVLFLLLSPPKPVTRGGEEIAQLVVRKGEVKFRPRESILWIDTVDTQRFVNGDTLVTGDRSRAIIRLSDRQTIELGPNSMIGLEMPLISTAVTNDISLLLFKGSAVAASTTRNDDQSFLSTVLGKVAWTKKQGAKPITINAADQAFRLPESGDAKLELFRDANEDSVRVTNVKGDVTAKAVPPLQASPDAHLIALMDGNVAPSQLANDAPEKVLTKDDIDPAPKPAGPAAPPPPEKTSLQNAFAALGESLFTFEVKEDPPPPPPPPPPPRNPPRLKLPPPPPVPVGPTPEELAAQEAAARAEAERLAQEAAERAEQERLAALRAETPAPDHLPQLSPTQSFVRLTGETMRGKCGADDVVVFVEPKPGVTPPRGWIPHLEFASSRDPQKRIRIDGENAFRRQRFVLPMREICELPRNKSAVGVTLQISVGVRYQDDGAEANKRDVRKLFLGSLADFPAVPITVYIGKKIKNPPLLRDWMPQVLVSAPAPGDYAIRLASARDLPLLFDLISSTGRFAYNDRDIASFASTVHLASAGNIMASVGAKTANVDLLRTLAMRFDANVAFEGDRSDIVAMPRAKANRAGLLRNFVRTKGAVQVVARNRLVLLKEDDLDENGNSKILQAAANSADSAVSADAKIHIP